MNGTWYQLKMPNTRRPLRTFRADDDKIAHAMAIGLVKAQVRRDKGKGLLWALYALAGGPHSERARRVLA